MHIAYIINERVPVFIAFDEKRRKLLNLVYA